MADTKYLIRRGNRWWVRRRTPKAVAGILGPWQERTTGTGDLREAQRKRIVILGEFEQACQLALGSQSFARDDPRRLLATARDLAARVKAGEITENEAAELLWIDLDMYPVRAQPGEQVIGMAFDEIQGRHRVDLKDAIESYLAEADGRVLKQTTAQKRRRLEALSDWIGPSDVATITRRTAGRYVTDVVMKAQAAVKTKKDWVSDLGAFFRWLRNRGELDANPFEGMTGYIKGSARGGTNGRRKVWTTDQLAKMLTDLDGNLWALGALALYTGMRLNEICETELQDVHDTHIHIPESKSEAGVRDVPIHPLLQPHIERLREVSTDGYLLSKLRRGGADKKRGKLIGNRFSKWKLANISRDSTVCFHTLRNTFITAMEEAGAAPTTIPLIVGHTRHGMTFRTYSAGLSLEKKLEAVSKVTFGETVDGLMVHRGRMLDVESRAGD